MIDYHLHTKRCHHAVGELEEYLEEARRKGLQEIGFADHFPLDLLDCPLDRPVSMAGEELEEYVQDVTRLASRGENPRIRLGIEVDFFPGKEGETRRLLAKYPFDYVLGSLHFLHGWDFTNPRQVQGFEEGCIETIYEDYFALVHQLAASRLFDSVAHIDVVRKFGYDTYEEHKTAIVGKTAGILKETGMCVEVNTSGWRFPVAEQYPSRDLLEACFQEDVPVTLGSDAHTPSQVGEGVAQAVRLLKDVGYRRVALYERRQRHYTNL